MVLSQRVGEPRSFWVGLLLSIATVGVYAIYWNYKAHAEIYRQFELSRENRDEGVIWYVLGIVLPPFLLVYAWVMASNVAYVRERMALRRGVSPLVFVTLVTLGFGIYFVVSLVAVLVDVDTKGLLLALGIAAVGFFATVPVAYYLLQRDINQVWVAYDARMGEIRMAAPTGAPALALALAPAQESSYFADPPPP